MHRPTVEHQQAAKRMLRYVAGMLDYRLHYEKAPNTARYIDYSNSDLAGDVDTSKSTSGTMFFLGSCLVCWQSVKQKVVALSSCEAEYIAPPLHQRKHSGWQGCSGSSWAEKWKWWS